MTGALDTKMRATAQRLVDKFGKPVTLRRTTSTFDPDTGTTTEGTTDHSVNAVIEPYDQRLIDGSIIQTGDMQASFPAKDLSVTPSTATDIIIMDGDEWQIVNVGFIWSGEEVALFQAHVRK